MTASRVNVAHKKGLVCQTHPNNNNFLGYTHSLTTAPHANVAHKKGLVCQTHPNNNNFLGYTHSLTTALVRVNVAHKRV